MTQEQNERFIKARRAVIESRFSHLNDMQRLAVLGVSQGGGTTGGSV